MERLIACVASVLLLVGCGPSGDVTPTPTELTLQERCDDYCARRNEDVDCGAMINCAALCGSLLANGMSCHPEIDAFFTCSEGPDVCAPGGSISCTDENRAIIACSTPDAGR